MASEDALVRDDERRTLIQLALGKASVAFMRQSADVVMPTEELLEVAEDIHAVWTLEVDNLAAEVRELRKFHAIAENFVNESHEHPIGLGRAAEYVAQFDAAMAAEREGTDDEAQSC